MEDTAICVCSHVYDEHESGGKECTVLMALERGRQSSAAA